MKENVIHRHMERTARNLLIVNLLLLAVVIGSFLFSFRYFYNFALGPFPIDRGELLAIEDPGTPFRYFVRVVGDEGIETGAVRTKGSVVKQSFNIIVISDRLLLVESDGKRYYGKEATGALVAVPREVQREIINPAVAGNRDLKGQILPFMLDATDFRMPGTIGIFIGLPLILVAAWNIRRALEQMSDPEKHPVTKVLAQFGDPTQIARDIDAEHHVSDLAHFGDITMTRSWMIRKRLLSISLGRLDDTLWVYKKVTGNSVNSIPIGKTHAVVIWFRGWSFPAEFRMSERVCDDVLDFFTKRVPWALHGFEYTLDSHIRNNPAEISEAVAERERRFKARPPE